MAIISIETVLIINPITRPGTTLDLKYLELSGRNTTKSEIFILFLFHVNENNNNNNKKSLILRHVCSLNLAIQSPGKYLS